MLSGTGVPSQNERVGTLPGEGEAVAPERILGVLLEGLPPGAELAISWRDWALGAGGVATAEASAGLRRRAEHALGEGSPVDPEDGWLLAWENADGNARMALAVALPQPVPEARRDSWCRLAKAMIGATLDTARAHARIVSL